MAQDLKRWRVHFRSPQGDQMMTLLANSKEKAEQEALRSQFRRQERFPLTFDRIQQAHERGDLNSEEMKAELERRKKDQGRYERGFKLVSVTEVK